MKSTAGFTNAARFRCLEDLQKDSMNLCLIYCGWEACDPSHRYGPNRRTSYLLHIVKEGKGKLELNNKVYHMKAGDIFIIPPHVEAWYEADHEDPWTYMWIGYTGMKSRECTENMGISLKEPVRSVNCLNVLVDCVEGILAAHQLSYEDELRRNGFLMLIFSDLIGDYRNSQPEGASVPHAYPGSVYVKHAVEYITFHYSNKIKINELADYIGVNRSYLTSSFKKVMGCSPQEFLVNYRIEKAKSLLKCTDESVCEVAAAVGYADQLAFSKIFKQHQGMGPRAYREMDNELVIREKKGDYERTRPM